MSEPLKYKKGLSVPVSDYFKSTEFDCTCPCLGDTLIDPVLTKRLDFMRRNIGKPIKITSGYRCAIKQQELRDDGRHTAAKVSTHEEGQAADVFVAGLTGFDLTDEALRAGFTSIGTAKTWAHVDIREGNRRWTY